MSAWELDVKTGSFLSCDRLGVLFGVRAGEPFTSQDLLARVNAADAIGLREKIRAVVESPLRNSFIAEFCVPVEGARDRYLKVLGAVTSRDLKGFADRMCGVTFDISHRRHADQHLQENQDRILKLSRLSAMGFLASVITHELNQPLTALINNLSVCEIALRRGNMTELAAELTEANKRLVFRISDIIRRTKSFVASGEIVRVRGSLSQVIQSTVRKILLLPGNDDLRITCSLRNEADAVEADMVQLEHVFYNILRNAAEATEDREGRMIRVETAAEGPGVVIHVIDNGCGLHDDQYETLFEPLWTSKETGTGLGLAVCRTVVEAHGGTIDAGPAPDGTGLDVQIVMPIRANDAANAASSDLAFVAGG